MALRTVRIEVRYREDEAAGAWRYLTVPPGQSHVTIPNMQRGKLMQIEARSVSACGTASQWAPQTHVIADATLLPHGLATISATSVADGVALAWTIDNPPQRTNVEYQVQRTTDSAGAPNDAAWVDVNRTRALTYTDGVTNGTLYWYRVRAIDYTGIFSDWCTPINSQGRVAVTTYYQTAAPTGTLRVGDLWYDTDDGNKIYRWNGSAWASARDAGIDQAQQAANVAGSGVPVLNPVFLNDLSGWTFDTNNAGEWYRETGSFSPIVGVGTYLVHKGVPGQATTTAHNIGGGISVKPGQGVTATVALRSLTGINQPNAGSRAYVRIGYYNSAGAAITNSTQGVTFCTPDVGGSNFTQGTSRVYGTAPANAVRAIVEIEFDNHTAGFFTATAAAIALQPGNIGEVPDGGGRFAVNQVDSNGLAIIDFSKTGHVNKTADYIGETSGRKWAAESGANITETRVSYDTARVNGATAAAVSDGAGRAQLGFDSSGFLTSGRHAVDLLKDGTFARVRAAALIGGSPVPVPAGKNMAGNPFFTQNTIGTATGTAFTAGQNICDGWMAWIVNSNFLCYWEVGSGDPLPNIGPHPYLSLRSGSIPNASAAVNWIQSSSSFPVKPGQVFALTLIGYNTFNVSPPAGVTLALRIGLRWVKGDGSASSASDSIVEVAISSGAQTISGTVTVPSDAAQAYLYCGQTVYNNSGAAWSGIAPFPFDTRLHYAACVSVQDLATEVTGTLSTQRNLPLVTWGNYGGSWSGLTLSYSSTTTSATISASAANFIGGGDSIAYNASSVTVSGSAGTTIKYYLYYDDPGMTGGSKALQATTSQITSLNANGRVLLGTCSVTYPTSGTGGGGGGTSCVTVDTILPGGQRAGDVQVGDFLEVVDPRTLEHRHGCVSFAQTVRQPCVRIRTESGVELDCSTSAPIALAGGGQALAPELVGQCIPVLVGKAWAEERVVAVEPLGELEVRHITCEDSFFLAGRARGQYLLHHNLKPLN